MAAQARLQMCESTYQSALASFNQEEAKAREAYKRDFEDGFTTEDFPLWAITNVRRCNDVLVAGDVLTCTLHLGTRSLFRTSAVAIRRGYATSP